MYFALDFYFAKSLILLLVLNFTLAGGGGGGGVVFVCLRHFFIFRILPWYEEGSSMFDMIYVFFYITLV